MEPATPFLLDLNVVPAEYPTLYRFSLACADADDCYLP